MKKNTFYIGALIIIFFSLIIFSFSPELTKAQAQNNYQQDSDYDGLTDSAEINIYFSDPLKADTDGDGYYDAAEVLLGSNPLDASDPGINSTQPLKSSISIPWYVARAAGIASYILMFLVVILGTGMTAGYIYNFVNPVKAWLMHKYLSLALGLTLLTHITSLLFDKFISFSILDVLIPFHSSFKPLFLSIGIFAFYVLLVIIFSSLWFRLKYKRAWRFIHYAVYSLFTFSLIHGLFIGTDSNTIAMRIIYISTGAIFLALLIYRFIIRYFKK